MCLYHDNVYCFLFYLLASTGSSSRTKLIWTRGMTSLVLSARDHCSSSGADYCQRDLIVRWRTDLWQSLFAQLFAVIACQQNNDNLSTIIRDLLQLTSRWMDTGVGGMTICWLTTKQPICNARENPKLSVTMIELSWYIKLKLCNVCLIFFEDKNSWRVAIKRRACAYTVKITVSQKAGQRIKREAVWIN